MGHRLPYHETCKNIHGHSYRLIVEVTGQVNEQGMVIDFGEISNLVKPIIDQLDHSFMVDPSDEMMLKVLADSGLKATHVDFFSTAENIVEWIANQIGKGLFMHANVNSISLSLFETKHSRAQFCMERA